MSKMFSRRAVLCGAGALASIVMGKKMMFAASAPDPFVVSEYPQAGYGGAPGQPGYAGRGWDVIRGKTEVSSIVADRNDTAVIIVDGQSEHATSGGTSAYSVLSTEAHQMNIYDGGIYRIADPVLGASYAESTGPSSPIGPLADRIIARGKKSRVIVVPIAIGGTPWSIYDPAVTGSLFSRVRCAILRLRARGLEPDFICAARGATDNGLGTSAASIKASVQAWAQGIRDMDCDAPIYLGKFTMASGATSATVRQGLTDAIDVGLDIRAGYDGDTNLTVAGGYRLADQTHLSNTGVVACGHGWADLLYP